MIFPIWFPSVEIAIIYIINSPVLSAYGDWRFRGPLSLDESRLLLRDGFVSAVGHAASASFLSTLLGIKIGVNRIHIEMQPGDRALVLRLRERLPENRMLSVEEMQAFPFELGELKRL